DCMSMTAMQLLNKQLVRQRSDGARGSLQPSEEGCTPPVPAIHRFSIVQFLILRQYLTELRNALLNSGGGGETRRGHISARASYSRPLEDAFVVKPSVSFPGRIDGELISESLGLVPPSAVAS